MTLEKTDWSGGFTDGNGNNTYPYKVEDTPTDVHAAREQNVIEGEQNDPQNYE